MPLASVTTAARAAAVLTIDLAAVADNYRKLCQELNGVECAAVVKADAYGLGLDKVAPKLWAAGARRFFTAQLTEAISLRSLLPKAEIYVLNGLMPGAERDYQDQAILPVLNSLEEVARYRALVESRPLKAALHVDTGMSRLGLPKGELARLAGAPDLLQGIEVSYLMSHLACGDKPEDPMNQQQLQDFQAAKERLKIAKASLANSPGLFMGSAFHFHLGRPGAALYGVNPTPHLPNPMRQVVQLKGKILQIRSIDAHSPVGYGASFRAKKPMRVATIGVGYADGYLRSLSGESKLYFEGEALDLIGRVSMDLITVDVTPIPEGRLAPGMLLDLLDANYGVDSLAEAAGTIGYEILTSLGQRYHRLYEGG